jgi:hypothetical protein
VSCTRDEFNRVRDAVLEVLDDTSKDSWYVTDRNAANTLLTQAEQTLFADALHEEAERRLLASLLAKYGTST